MPIDWKSPEAYTHLLAAVVASQDMKLDYRRIASLYGQGATYDSIEGRFRIIKREALVLKELVESGARSEVPARGSISASTSFTALNEVTPKKEKAARKPRTPKKNTLTAEEKVVTGRVTKATPTKNKKANANAVKGIKEEVASSESSFFVGDAGVEASGTEDGTEHTEEHVGWDFNAAFEDVMIPDMDI